MKAGNDMVKISKGNQFSLLVSIETLKKDTASKEEKDKATSFILNTLKPYFSKR